MPLLMSLKLLRLKAKEGPPFGGPEHFSAHSNHPVEEGRLAILGCSRELIHRPAALHQWVFSRARTRLNLRLLVLSQGREVEGCL